MVSVSVIVPCYNEQNTIQLLLDALAGQTFPVQELEVIIADGMSTDQTRMKIAEFQYYHPEMFILIVDNPTRHIPAALNRALEAARGTFIVRMDAHAVPAQDYIARCVEALEARCGDNVGGVWEIQPGHVSRSGVKAAPWSGDISQTTWLSRAIAVASAHPLGVGDAHYRHATQPQQVDTVPFGAFRRELVEKVGMFDENLLTNEDYEFNVRIRQLGGKIWLDPSIRSTYFARATLTALARQYLRYGYWKGQMLRRYPETIRWRQVIPPAFVLSLVVLALLTPFLWGRVLFAVEIGVYFAVLFGAGVHSAIKVRDPGLVLGLPLAISTMHLCWGGALLWSLNHPPNKKV